MRTTVSDGCNWVSATARTQWTQTKSVSIPKLCASILSFDGWIRDPGPESKSGPENGAWCKGTGSEADRLNQQIGLTRSAPGWYCYPLTALCRVNKLFTFFFQLTCRKAIRKRGSMSLQSLTGWVYQAFWTIKKRVTWFSLSVLSQCREAAREYIGGLDGLRRFFSRHQDIFRIEGDRNKESNVCFSKIQLGLPALSIPYRICLPSHNLTPPVRSIMFDIIR